VFFALFQLFLAVFILNNMEAELKRTIGSEFAQTETTVHNILRHQGEQILQLHTQAILNAQLQYLGERAGDFKNAAELARFCINDSRFQSLALRSFGRYGYTNVSIRDGEKLICVAHPKGQLQGKDLFAVVAGLGSDAARLQNTDEFVKHWTMKLSGTIEFEQTDTFLPGHIPAAAGRKKIAHQIWDEVSGIPYVAETTTYLAEFLEPVDLIIANQHAAVTRLENEMVAGLDSWAKLSLAAALLALVTIALVAAVFNRRFVSQPLVQIGEGLQRFRQRDFSKPICCDADNELGEIAGVTGAMAMELGQTLTSLEESRNELEKKVVERTSELAEANRLLEIKTAQTERLLQNTLPRVVAERLKSGEELIVDDFALATVIFTDFKGFTQLAESVTPDRLVLTLNEIFACFDRFAEELGIEKIKTIGDSYMAVGGVPVRDENHPAKVVELGLRMRDYIAERSKDQDLLQFQIRIGIHSGPVVAGVIGRSKFSYDLWGDTVNIASRCESSSEPMKVNISQSTYKLVKDHFVCEPRGMVAAKGKGEIAMYFVERRT
jgi:class 3 adenylate cyclase